MHDKIKEAKDRLDASQKNYADMVAEVRSTCEHTNLAECEYKPMRHLDPFPPMRVCRDCGLTEEGWGCGYQTLIGEAVHISREKLYEHRI